MEYIKSSNMDNEQLKSVYVEASDKNHSWDSDYVSSMSMTIEDAINEITYMKDDPEWCGWSFRIMHDSKIVLVGDGPAFGVY